MTNIPTPETDAAYVYELLGVAEPLVRISFARDLERRLAAATARADRADKFRESLSLRHRKVRDERDQYLAACHTLKEELDRLRKEVERLREDKERLDWLSENVRQNEGLAVGGYWYRSKLRWQETRLRAAIDAAMSLPTHPSRRR